METRYQFPEVDGFSINELLPPPSKQQELLSNMLLTLTRAEFNSKNESQNILDPNVDESYDRNEKTQGVIEANEGNGVFGFS